MEGDDHEPRTELRQRPIIVEDDEKEIVNESDEGNVLNSSDVDEAGSIDEKEVLIDEKAIHEISNESIHELKSSEIPLIPRRLQQQQQQQPARPPSVFERQVKNVKNFFLEIIDFILLFLTTLFNPMADVNTQVQDHNQRRRAREGRYYSSCKPTSSFPGCGPSS